MIKDSLTEQEKRELAIARMIKDSEPHETDVTIEQYIDIVRRGGFQSFVRAYDAGYRKEKEVREEIFSRIYDEIHENFRKDSNITGQELLEFIQRIDFQLFKEIEE